MLPSLSIYNAHSKICNNTKKKGHFQLFYYSQSSEIEYIKKLSSAYLRSVSLFCNSSLTDILLCDVCVDKQDCLEFCQSETSMWPPTYSTYTYCTIQHVASLSQYKHISYNTICGPLPSSHHHLHALSLFVHLGNSEESLFLYNVFLCVLLFHCVSFSA